MSPRPHALPLSLLAALASVAACSRPLDVPVPGTLVVDGRRIVDSQGRTALLRGVNAGGRSKFAPYVPYAGEDVDSYLDRAATWGIDVLRLPFAWAAVEPTRGEDDEAYLTRYDALVDGAWARGMATIVDFHQDIYTEAWCGDGFPAWTLDPPPEGSHHDCPDWFFGYFGDTDVDAAFDAFWADTHGARTAQREMWVRMATRYADHPGVVGYELINEPHAGTAEGDPWAATTLPAWYEEVGAAVHAADPDALLFVDTTGLDAISATTALTRPDLPNLVLAPHYYDPGTFSGGAPVQDPAVLLGQWAAVGEDWNVPVLVGEFGADPDLEWAPAHIAGHYDAFDALGMSATIWEYSVSAELWNEEDLSLVDGAGVERPTVAAMARPYPAYLAGTGEWTWDGTTFRLTVEGTGVTEIRWPSRLGPYTADAEGAPLRADADRLWVETDGPTVVTVTAG